MSQEVVLVCPSCESPVENYYMVYGFRAASTTIGASTVGCENCGEEVLTGRSEWREKSIVGKAWFWIFRGSWAIPSAMFFGAIGFMGFEFVRIFFLNPRRKVLLGLNIQSCPLVVGALTAGLALGLTAWRCVREIHNSNHRYDQLESDDAT